MEEPESSASPEGNVPIEWISHLWSEYQYRHDLVWKRIFTTAFVVAFLSVIPYLQPNLIPQLGWAIIGVPVLALPFLIVATIVIHNEYKLFQTVKTAYRAAMGSRLPAYPGPAQREKVLVWRFARVVLYLLWALNLVAVFHQIHQRLSG